MDTTVTESDIAYPTDTGLLYQGVRKLGHLVKKLQKKGLAKVDSFVDHTWKAKKLLREATRSLRERAGAGLRSVLVELAVLAEDTLFTISFWIIF